MDRKPVYRCEKCGWKGMLTVAMMPMHPSERDGPRCPKCFSPLAEAGPEGKGKSLRPSAFRRGS